MGLRWSEKEDNLLRDFYPNLPDNEIKPLFEKIGRNWTSVKNRAFQLGIVRLFNSKKTSNVSILLDDNLISYYWMGFIYADGHIKTCGRLIVSGHTKDIDHLRKFAALVNAKVHIYKYSYEKSEIAVVSVYDKFLIPKIAKKFDIKPRKTYEPPNFEKLPFTKEQLIAILIGFIDGDGSRRNDCNAFSIGNHINWFDIHKYFSKNVFQDNKVSIRTYENKSIMWIGSGWYRILLEFVKLHKLPILERKWYERKYYPNFRQLQTSLS